MSATEMITTICDTCMEPIVVPKRPYRAKRLCEGCAAFDRLRGIEKAAQALWDMLDGQRSLDRRSPSFDWDLNHAYLELRDALEVPEPKGDH